MGAAMVISGCSSVLSGLPHQVGGLREGAPERSADPPAFPQVHDMPPKRSEAVLTAEERKKVEADLAAARENAARRAAEAEAARLISQQLARQVILPALLVQVEHGPHRPG